MLGRGRGAGRPRRDGFRIGGRGLAIVLTALVVLASCERTPSKSDYVSARVTALCAEETTVEGLQSCRLAVINQFKDTPLEELERTYPRPEPRPRPSCSPW
ncbi:MAG: hypothetical protein H6748_06025 [Spirochaetaceae bacterium]|nr:hypothetical protein [Myxococcales bacterium]MCB9723584.1 hypothetical protein [Spirochaetaceae bacterium]HPG24897.1 hypothetical protein [Myxococcota bacterium]